jgi:hypothetical protein
MPKVFVSTRKEKDGMTSPRNNGRSLRFHGITSGIFAGVAVCLGGAAIFRTSFGIGLCYLLVCPISLGVVLYAYCAKCPCQADCAHVLPGRAAALFGRRPGPYSTAEIAAMGASLLLLIGVPQFFLWRYPAAWIAFWILLGIALIQIRGAVCRACGNTYCPLCMGKRAP